MLALCAADPDLTLQSSIEVIPEHRASQIYTLSTIGCASPSLPPPHTEKKEN